MSFVRTMKRENPFVQLDKDFIGNGKLSLKATGLLTYILSKPDGWQIRMKDIQKRFNDGETSIRSAMNELMKEGYVNRFRDRADKGTFGDYVYEVYERPEFNPKRENHVMVDSPKRDFPELDNPELDNHVHSNKDFSNNDFSNKKEEEEEENQLAELIALFSDCIGPVNKIIENKIVEWLKKLPFVVIKAEIENAAIYGGRSWAYVEKLLNEDKKKKLRSADDINKKVLDYTSRKKKPGNSNRKSVRTEILPDWFEESPYEQQAKKDTPEDIEKKKQEILRQLDEPEKEVVEAKKQSIQEKLKIFNSK